LREGILEVEKIKINKSNSNKKEEISFFSFIKEGLIITLELAQTIRF
jgi:hypothetical protein